jgi:hypothetical protein
VYRVSNTITDWLNLLAVCSMKILQSVQVNDHLYQDYESCLALLKWTYFFFHRYGNVKATKFAAYKLLKVVAELTSSHFCLFNTSVFSRYLLWDELFQCSMIRHYHMSGLSLIFFSLDREKS